MFSITAIARSTSSSFGSVTWRRRSSIQRVTASRHSRDMITLVTGNRTLVRHVIQYDAPGVRHSPPLE